MPTCGPGTRRWGPSRRTSSDLHLRNAWRSQQRRSHRVSSCATYCMIFSRSAGNTKKKFASITLWSHGQRLRRRPQQPTKQSTRLSTGRVRTRMRCQKTGCLLSLDLGCCGVILPMIVIRISVWMWLMRRKVLQLEVILHWFLFWISRQLLLRGAWKIFSQKAESARVGGEVQTSHSGREIGSRSSRYAAGTHENDQEFHGGASGEEHGWQKKSVEHKHRLDGGETTTLGCCRSIVRWRRWQQ